MNALTAIHDTNTKEYDIEKFKVLGLSVLAGKLAGDDQQQRALLRILPVGCDKITRWLAEDFNNNVTILDAMTTRLAVLFSTEDVISIWNDNLQSDPAEDIIAAIKGNAPLPRDQETLNLAARVVAMVEDNRSIEVWAEDLSQDISQGDD